MATLAERIAAARGSIPCDVVLSDVNYLDVFSCEWRNGNLSIYDGVIVGVDAPLESRRVIDGRGKSVVPGFIDAHVHVESSLLVPQTFSRVVLPKGTTTAICDPHELANVLGVEGIRYFLDTSESLHLDLKVMLSSCVPATTFETNGGGTLQASDLLPLAARRNALGLAEVMNVPAVLNQDPAMMAKLESFTNRPIDGHCPLLGGQDLAAYAVARITSCHECSELPEAEEKLSKGLSVWIREGSVAKDLNALHSLLRVETSTSVGFCTDDRNPLDIAEEGHVDHLVRQVIRKGVSPAVAFRAASLSVARHYGLAGPSVPRPVGAVAPGYRADLVVLGDVATCAIDSVFKNGVLTSELDHARAQLDAPKNTIQATLPEEADLVGPSGQVHVIDVKPGKILTGRLVSAHNANGVMPMCVVERYGNHEKPANGYVRGFGDLRGAIASSVGHDSHNLIAVGDNAKSMRAALGCLIASGGGFVVVRGTDVAAHLPLPFGGLMSMSAPEEIAKTLQILRDASQSIGCTLHEPFLQLAFLSLPVIPQLKLTNRGLMDVDAFRLIDVRAA